MLLLIIFFSFGAPEGLRRTKGRMSLSHLSTTSKGSTRFFFGEGVSVATAWLRAFDLLFAKIMTKKKRREGLTAHLHLMENYGFVSWGWFVSRERLAKVTVAWCFAKWLLEALVLLGLCPSENCRTANVQNFFRTCPSRCVKHNALECQKLLASVLNGDVRIGVFPCLSTLWFQKEKSFSAGLHWSRD